ncbi:hypothetical protein [Anaplasma bovis]|uniref:hypothetical protein n=1 Tax=Anaplasma bovis TaxID=186733 RepID=UPI002FF2D81E
MMQSTVIGDIDCAIISIEPLVFLHSKIVWGLMLSLLPLLETYNAKRSNTYIEPL